MTIDLRQFCSEDRKNCMNTYDLRYLHMIAALPGAMMTAVPVLTVAPIMFSFDSGIGVLMPKRY